MNDNELFELYKTMKMISAAEEKIALLYDGSGAEKKIFTSIHLYSGQEAIAAGVCFNLDKKDTVFSNHRCHGHYLAKGGSLKKMFAELYGKETGCCKGFGGSMHLCDMEAGVAPSSGIVGGTVSVATGYALANKLKKNGAVVCVFLGDGASEEGSVYESICYAAIRKIPILYVCENNLLAIKSPLEPREPLHSISKKFSNILPTQIIDGNDVESVAESSRRMINDIRQGGGPFFLECNTWRSRAHHGTGYDMGQGIRTEEKMREWEEKNPIKLAEKKLIETDANYEKKIKLYDLELSKEIEEACAYAENSSIPQEEALWANN